MTFNSSSNNLVVSFSCIEDNTSWGIVIGADPFEGWIDPHPSDPPSPSGAIAGGTLNWTPTDGGNYRLTANTAAEDAGDNGRYPGTWTEWSSVNSDIPAAMKVPDFQSDYWTCSITRLVVEQVSQKCSAFCCFLMVVVQKLKFLNNSIIAGLLVLHPSISETIHRLEWERRDFLLLVIDIGTSAFKSALFGFNGECSAVAAAPLSIESHDGRCEAEPGQWLRAFEECCRRMGSLRGVEAVVISGNGPSLVPVTGAPACTAEGLRLEAAAAQLWLDRRAEEEAAEVSAAMGDFVDAGFFLPKALGIKNREPGLYEKTRAFLSCPEYLAYALTGEARTVFPSEGFDRWFWNGGVLKKLGLDPEKFPSFISPGDVIGTLLPAAAKFLGFSGPVPVIAEGPDFFAAILGSGAACPGDGCDRSGSSEGINVCTGKQIIDPRLMSYGHPVKPWWNLSGIISTTGKAIDRVMALLGITAGAYGEFFALAEQAEPGAGGLLFLPYLAGERAPIWDAHARGGFMGLGLDTGRAELARSTAEGICFAIRDVIAVMEDAGAPVRNLRVSGGPAASDFLNQLKADISGREVLSPAVQDAELLGNACTGAAALGIYGSAGEAAAALVKIRRAYHPGEKKAGLYEGLFAKYRDLYRSLKKYFATPAEYTRVD
jgi:xylulokinase